MSIFVIKIIACITMFLDHIKYAIPETTGGLTIYLGRVSFPLFAFMIGEGYAHTKNLKKYYKRLIIFALISQIPFMLFRTLVGEWLMLNIMFTLILGLFAIFIFDNLKDKYYISIPLVALIAYVGQVLNVDYGWYGVLMVFVLYLVRENKVLRFFVLAILNLVYYYNRFVGEYLTENLLLYMCATLPGIILLAYNGKLGRKSKYFFYIFYPVHMLIFYIINLM